MFPMPRGTDGSTDEFLVQKKDGTTARMNSEEIRTEMGSSYFLYAVCTVPGVAGPDFPDFVECEPPEYLGDPQ